VEDGMAYYSVGIEDGTYDVHFDVDAHRYVLVCQKTGRVVFAGASDFYIEDLDLDLGDE